MKLYIRISKIFITASLLISSTNFAFAIWNGKEENNVNDFKFMVSMQTHRHSTPDKWTHWCGGSIISKNFVLLGAHCVADDGAQPNVKPIDPSAAQIVTRDGQVIPIKSIHIKSNFYWQAVSDVIAPGETSYIAENDLALIELATPVGQENVISLPKWKHADKYYAPGKSVLSIGYGY